MLSAEEIERITHLARLALTAEEKASYAVQLSAILDYAAQLEAIDVSDIAPTATVLSVRSVMREGDQVSGTMPHQDALANAPKTDGDSFEVQAAIAEAE